MGTPGRQVGIIYGEVGSTQFDLAVSDVSLKRLDYVETLHAGAPVLGLVTQITRRGSLSFEEALAGDAAGKDALSAHVQVIGSRNDRGLVHVPRTPLASGAPVRAATDALVTRVLGLAQEQGAAYLGHIKGLSVPVHLHMNTLAQKHVSVLAKTGAGKSYTVGVLVEEFIQAQVPLVVLDPHGEYGALRRPNAARGDVPALRRFNVKPKGFGKQLQEFAVDTQLNPEAEALRLEAINLEAREIVDILPAKLNGGQIGVLYQAIKDLRERPGYTLEDIADAVSANKSSAKWNVLNAIEALRSTNIFHLRGTAVEEIVQPGTCTIINLKGVPPDVQEIVAARLGMMLWEARKRNDVPPFVLVVEEAHNFCPERGVGNAVSGPILRTIASEGRKFGLGLCIVSQRPAKVDKNVLSQCNAQFVLKVTNPNDLKAIVASVEGITADSADEIQRLEVGTALVAGGGLTHPVFVDVRPRMTLHGGASIDVVGTPGQAPEPTPPLNPEPVPVAVAEPVEAPSEDAADADVSWALESPTWDEATEPPDNHAPDPVQPVKPSIPEAIERNAARPRPAKPVRLNKRARQSIHRVAKRVGFVATDDPERTADLLAQLALSEGLQPDHYQLLYRDVATQVCTADAPACIRCPLRKDCAYHADLQAQRQKHRANLRRLWRRT